MAIAALPQTLQKRVARDDRTAVALDRLEQETGGLLDARACIVQVVVEQREGGLTRVGAERPLRAVRIGVGQELPTGGHAEGGSIRRLAGEGDTARRASDVAATESDHLAAPRGRTGEGNGDLRGLRASNRGDHSRQRLGCNADQALVEVGAHLRRRGRRAVRHDPCLLNDGGRHTRMAEPHRGGCEATVHLQIRVAVRIPDPRTLGALPDNRIVGAEGAQSGALKRPSPSTDLVGAHSWSSPSTISGSPSTMIVGSKSIPSRWRSHSTTPP